MMNLINNKNIKVSKDFRASISIREIFWGFPKWSTSKEKCEFENFISFQSQNCSTSVLFLYITFRAYILCIYSNTAHVRIYFALFSVVPLKFVRNSFAWTRERMRDMEISIRCVAGEPKITSWNEEIMRATSARGAPLGIKILNQFLHELPPNLPSASGSRSPDYFASS